MTAMLRLGGTGPDGDRSASRPVLRAGRDPRRRPAEVRRRNRARTGPGSQLHFGAAQHQRQTGGHRRVDRRPVELRRGGQSVPAIATGVRPPARRHPVAAQPRPGYQGVLDWVRSSLYREPQKRAELLPAWSADGRGSRPKKPRPGDAAASMIEQELAPVQQHPEQVLHALAAASAPCPSTSASGQLVRPTAAATASPGTAPRPSPAAASSP